MARTHYDQMVTLNKRKRGILRKAIELSDLCHQEVYIAIFDKAKNHLVEYKSSDIINPPKLTKMARETSITHERYDNNDYELLSAKFITRENMETMQEMKSMTWAGASVTPVAAPTLKVSIPSPPLISPKLSVFNKVTAISAKKT